MKKVVKLVLLILSVFCLVIAAKAESSGTCGLSGDNLTWVFDDTGLLTISGIGEMKDFSSNLQPWRKERAAINAVVIEPGVTAIW